MEQKGPGEQLPPQFGELVDKPISEMTLHERQAWYLEYMKSVPEENIMMVSGMMMEIEEDSKAFSDYVMAFQQLMKQGLV